MTKVQWSSGSYFVTGADGTGLPEPELKRVPSTAKTKFWAEAEARDAAPRPKPKFKIGEKVCTSRKWFDDPRFHNTISKRKWSIGSWSYHFKEQTSSNVWYGESTLIGNPNRK